VKGLLVRLYVAVGQKLINSPLQTVPAAVVKGLEISSKPTETLFVFFGKKKFR
jgi:hypothetical protein